MASFIMFLMIGAVAGWYFKDDLRRLFSDTCKHGIPHDSICVACREREDRRG